MQEEKSGTMVATEQGSYYYHPDHLGSSSVVTDKAGKFYEQLEYFPYGETWIHNKADASVVSTPYKFTSKELDEETGLYYFGYRYLDPKLSCWISADPAMVKGDYLPLAPINDNAKKQNSNLPGMGGVFNTINLDVYHYAGQNPVKLVDPDGNDFIAVVFPHGAENWGHAAVIIVNQKGKAILYEQGNWGNTETDKKEKIRKNNLSTIVQFDGNGNPTDSSMKKLLKEVAKYREKKLGRDDVEAVYIKTSKEETSKMMESAEKRFKTEAKDREDYSELNNSCIGFVKDVGAAGGIINPSKIVPKEAVKEYTKYNDGHYYKYDCKTKDVGKGK